MIVTKCCGFVVLLGCVFHSSSGDVGRIKDKISAKVDELHESVTEEIVAYGGDYAVYADYDGYYTTEEKTTVDPSHIGPDCIDRKGKYIPVGQDYLPYPDSPCTICECLEDKRMMSCSSVGCDDLECLNFDIDEDSCCGYTCTDGGSFGSLDLRQVGQDSVLVQLSFDDPRAANFTWDKMVIYYSEGFGKEKPWIEVPTRVEDNSAMVSGLKHGIKYTFKGQVKLHDNIRGVGLSFQAARIVLEQRVGNFLRLDRKEHAKDLVLQAGTGAYFRWQQSVFINLNAFDYASVGRKTNKKGELRNTIKLYKVSSNTKIGQADLTMFIADSKLFHYIKAHL